MTRAEALSWSYLRRHGLNSAKFRRQHPVRPYIADFARVAAKLVVEVDGYTHWSADELAHDSKRTKFLEGEGWRVLRVTNVDVYDNLDGVWRAIASLISPPAASRRPPPHAGEE
ncbi:MAG: endonuclease domain-containing protein [Proteobacteria bacterium]|nr:endonuclease domain-containing protein [Pseudomonadota bacterium]